MLNKCWLIDGTEIFNSEFLTGTELAKKQAEAQEATDGNLWWVCGDEPLLPRAESYRHISRDDIALNNRDR